MDNYQRPCICEIYVYHIDFFAAGLKDLIEIQSDWKECLCGYVLAESEIPIKVIFPVPMLLNYSVQMGTGVQNMLNLLTIIFVCVQI